MNYPAMLQWARLPFIVLCFVYLFAGSSVVGVRGALAEDRGKPNGFGQVMSAQLNQQHFMMQQLYQVLQNRMLADMNKLLRQRNHALRKDASAADEYASRAAMSALQAAKAHQLVMAQKLVQQQEDTQAALQNQNSAKESRAKEADDRRLQESDSQQKKEEGDSKGNADANNSEEQQGEQSKKEEQKENEEKKEEKTEEKKEEKTEVQGANKKHNEEDRGAKTSAADKKVGEQQQQSGSGCMQSFSGDKLGDAAAALSADYSQRGVKYNQKQREFGPAAKKSDCSSFVQSALEKAGYGCLFTRTKAQTGAMRSVISEKGGTYRLTDPKKGDLIMWEKGGSGHVAIVTGVCEGNKIKMAHMGNSGTSFSSLNKCRSFSKTPTGSKYSTIVNWGSCGADCFKGFWTPK